MWFFRAVALDLDGTLAENDHLGEAAMAAIKASRDERRIILVTGRIFDDLEAAFPGLWREFDAVVTENGAVLHTGSGAWPLASPIEAPVGRAQAERGVADRASEVLVVTRAGQPDGLIPMIHDVVQELDIAGSRIVVRLLEGLLETREQS